ncbi:MAG TPA: DinB family protein [Longimicrobium sp.]|nr:DinB family protein [Longimicrobium sp.]
MSTAAPATNRDIETFRHQARMTHQVVRINVDGITHEESLAQPRPNGNCLNWVLGHLVCIYGRALPLLGQEPVTLDGALDRYDRGTAPIVDPAEAIDLQALRAAWDTVSERWDTGLGELPADALDQPAPFSPSDNPDETVRSLISTVAFHQAYHAGQTGVLRRIAGKDGAIR